MISIQESRRGVGLIFFFFLHALRSAHGKAVSRTSHRADPGRTSETTSLGMFRDSTRGGGICGRGSRSLS